MTWRELAKIIENMSPWDKDKEAFICTDTSLSFSDDGDSTKNPIKRMDYDVKEKLHSIVV